MSVDDCEEKKKISPKPLSRRLFVENTQWISTFVMESLVVFPMCVVPLCVGFGILLAEASRPRGQKHAHPRSSHGSWPRFTS